MDNFVQLWVYLSSAPLFGLTATLLTYVAMHAAYDRFGHAPWANPVLWSVVVLGGVLLATGTPFQTYFAGAQFVHFLLGPAVVALGWPLWQRRTELKTRGFALVVAATIGGAVASLSAVAGAWLLGLPGDVIRSLAPKSTTAPVAMGIAERIGGVPSLAAAFAVVTGIVGALSARYLFDLLRVGDLSVRGFALGTTSHGIGVARALQVDPDAGAYAGLALGLQVLVASVWLPLAARLVS
ncbi:MAG: LrgB family protein [Gammaproteobacteria bacterium]